MRLPPCHKTFRRLAWAIAAVAVLWAIQTSRPGGFEIGQGAFASNAYGQENGRIFYDLPGAFIAEVVLTALFLIVILGVTTKAASKAQAAIGIGFMLTLIHLISIPITNTSVNPARSLGPALFEGGTALTQLWLFIVAPIIGGAVGNAIDRARFGAVVDFVDVSALGFFPWVFNVADAAITIGVLLMLLDSFRKDSPTAP